MDILLILGRGIQMLQATDPVSEVRSWQLTEDLEMCTELGAHPQVRVPVDDNDPNCLVGGAQLNLEAGKVLIRQHSPQVVVCAYGDRSKYLKDIGGPSESQVMTGVLQKDLVDADLARKPELVIWDPARSKGAHSNTRQEILNVFDLAIELGLERIGFVTVGVHVPRTATFIAKHISTFSKYQHLSPVMFESEEVLLGSSDQWKSRVDTLRNSQAFSRNLTNEFRGTLAALTGKYNAVKEQTK
ncbi:MAG: hypothetical protein A2534_05210 [Candidatus Magasanikbacteria bacterium RIFOXYD2_FULL_39_9]|nr:MAG: hypothetical protein A2534_05210 [Candidatus Magasanikbacteria bacterium RIFOXYD2_FULL_39_9]